MRRKLLKNARKSLLVLGLSLLVAGCGTKAAGDGGGNTNDATNQDVQIGIDAEMGTDAVADAGCTIDSDCDDQNPCTDDICKSNHACQHVTNSSIGCGDVTLDADTANDVDGTDAIIGTDASVIVDADAASDTLGDSNGCKQDADCVDGNPCTDDICKADGTCAHMNNDNATCSDGDPCTSNDHCSLGACLGSSGDAGCGSDADTWNAGTDGSTADADTSLDAAVDPCSLCTAAQTCNAVTKQCEDLPCGGPCAAGQVCGANNSCYAPCGGPCAAGQFCDSTIPPGTCVSFTAPTKWGIAGDDKVQKVVSFAISDKSKACDLVNAAGQLGLPDGVGDNALAGVSSLVGSSLQDSVKKGTLVLLFEPKSYKTDGTNFSFNVLNGAQDPADKAAQVDPTLAGGKYTVNQESYDLSKCTASGCPAVVAFDTATIKSSTLTANADKFFMNLTLSSMTLALPLSAVSLTGTVSDANSWVNTTAGRLCGYFSQSALFAAVDALPADALVQLGGAAAVKKMLPTLIKPDVDSDGDGVKESMTVSFDIATLGGTITGMTGLPPVAACTSAADCDDQNVCTTDGCPSGTCTHIATVCNDGIPCTDDSCDAALGCQYVNNTAACDDGDTCFTGDMCSGGTCQPGTTPKNCSDGNSCTTDTCSASTCSHATAPANTACDDLNACTTNDVCTGTTCGGTAKSCDDQNDCTTDSCDAGSGTCLHVQVADGTVCAAGTCTNSLCVKKGCTQDADCNDNNQCTTDSCSNSACVNTPTVPAACNDNNPCTDDSCSANKCVNTANDNNSAGGGSCAPDECSVGTLACKAGATACTWTGADPLKDGQTCGSGGVCKSGVCFINDPPVAGAYTLDQKPAKAGVTVNITVAVSDNNTDSSKSIDDIKSVTADLSAFGGSSTTAVTTKSSGADVHSSVYSFTVDTTGLATGTYLVPVTVTDKSVEVDMTYVPVYVYTGNIIPVGATQTAKSISAGITAASSGDVVLIDDGTYTGTTNKSLNTIAKQIIILGKNGSDKVTIDCGNAGRAFNFTNPGGTVSATVAGVTITNCAAGAIKISTAGPDLATVTLSESVIQGNTNTIDGGGVAIIGAGSTLTTVQTKFDSNIAGAPSVSGKGGAIYLNNSIILAYSCNFTGNSSAGGQCVYAAGTADASLIDDDFSANGAPAYPSYADVSGDSSTSTISVKHGLFHDEPKASCIYYSGNLSVTDTRFVNIGQTAISGYSPTCTASHVRISGSNFNNVLLSSCAVSDTLISGGASVCQLGCGMYSCSASCPSAITGDLITNTTVSGVKYVNTTGYTSTTPVIQVTTIVGSTFTGLASTGCIVNTKSISGSSVTSNSGDAGTICITQGGGTISNSVIVENKTIGNGGGITMVPPPYDYSQSCAAINGVTVANNQAPTGGGIYFAPNCSASLSNSIVWGNSATGANGLGGQIYVGTNSSAIAVTNCDIRNDPSYTPGDIVDDAGKINTGGYSATSGNLSVDPKFVKGKNGGYYLSQTSSGQASNSPCIDAGIGKAVDAALNALTTRTDGVGDSGTLDMGYHYAP